MSSGLSHREDVEFLESCNSSLVERNADEFTRLHDMLTEIAPSAERAERHTRWKSEGSRHYEARLAESRKLVAELAEGYGKAAGALRDYAFALATAKAHYANGKANEQALSKLILTKGTAITRAAQQAEPMRQWEDMRATTGVLDFLAELTMDVDDIRDEADRLHDAAGGDFHLAGTVEREAREICVHQLKQAYDLLPDFRMGFIDRVDIVSAIGELRREAAEARDNPLTRLPGSGPKQDYYPAAGDDIVSPTLRDIRLRVASLPDARDSYWSPPGNARERAEWITANKEIIESAARNAGLPPDMVAGIAWQEIGGQPGILDDITDTLREQADSPLSPIAPESLPWRLGGDPDNTSMGPIAIQVRRGAEVLGYDPAHLTEQQRNVVEDALQDPAQNIFIASEYLAQLKAESEFADVPAKEMTPAQYGELAARYNGGPSWQTDDAQAYGRGFMNNLDEARSALR
ncbi:hypothetical protein [Streptomyces tagetis]|uniref:Uncharacterized protein n=1 Tax=Streptomyces tagetis TaxID=2820809 RepID=A0A940XJ53_9ACTN|nr:hypothetical protein [Streptomyces sp. RG38]MBQ0825575.1 hypothetical protein [Streptomyces sp. RG38]